MLLAKGWPNSSYDKLMIELLNDSNNIDKYINHGIIVASLYPFELKRPKYFEFFRYI